MNVANIKYYDIANGYGVRTSLFVSGCRHHCKGCFNRVAWDFQYGKPYTTEVEYEILNSIDNPRIRGLSILGGEPFEPENRSVLTGLLMAFKNRFADKDVWIWSGFTHEELLKIPDCAEMLSFADALVDGRFVEEEKDISLQFRGSKNQRIIKLK